MQLCKKMDSIMMHSGRNTPSDSFLAPILYCGYLLLVNGEEEENCNCQVLRVIIDGTLRVVLISTRTIAKGEELFYHYGSSYKF